MILGLLALIGCDLPHDPEGTYQRVRGGMLRVGITEHPPWTDWRDSTPTGIEVELVQQFADRLDAEIEWTRSSESELLRALHRRELDLVVGGLTASTPWSDQVGLTRPYLTLADAEHVMAVPQGENRWLLELDRFLQSQRGMVGRLPAAEAPQ